MDRFENMRARQGYSESTVELLIAPQQATVTRGEKQAFTVNGDADWSISGNVSSNTRISNAGVLTVDEDEKAQIITVIATAGNVSAFALVKLQTVYTVTFDANGGTFDDGTSITTKKFERRELLENSDFPNIAREEYTLKGWYSDTGELFTTGIKITSDMIFKAKWIYTNQEVNYVMLYNSGDECVDITGGYGMFHHSNYGRYGVVGTKYDTYIHIGANASDTNVHKNVYTNNKIDITDYVGYSIQHYTNNQGKLICGFTVTKPDNNDNIWLPNAKVDSNTVATTGDIIGTNAKVWTSNDISEIDGSYYFDFTCYKNGSVSGSNFYSDIYKCLMYKADDWQTLANIAGISAESIEDVLANSSILLSNKEAVEYMIHHCTGEFMIKASQSQTFLIAFSECEYIDTICENEHWVMFLGKPGFIEYIESTGTQYINADYYPNGNTKYELKIKNNTKNGVLFGAYNSTWENGSGLYTNPQTPALDWLHYNSNINTNHASGGNKEIILDKGRLVINGTMYVDLETKSFTVNRPLYIFAGNMKGNVEQPTAIQLCYFKIYDNDELVRYFKPYRKPDGVCCLYDEVSKTYFENAGTGQFIGSEA